MNRKLLKRSVALMMLLSATVVPQVVAPNQADADEIDLHRLLVGPQRCDHVISLLMRYGVNNDHDQSVGFNIPHPLGPIQVPVSELGDLEMYSIVQHAAPQPGCGPAFDVVIKNCSTRDVQGMRVTLVGLLGRIHPTCPNVTETIDCIAAGEAIQLTMTLPVEALAMGQFNGGSVGCSRILVAVDSYDQFMESNEANNLRVMAMKAIPVAELASPPVPADPLQVEVTPGVANVTQPDSSQPVGAAPNAASPTTDAVNLTSTSPAEAAPLQQSDLRSAIEQFGQQSDVADEVR
ncbi:hypothetical protein [Rhodopirellula sp. MGV]|uniref:hypothetical protein n=1 Tax=Rhodopirellula sp. MGV TaxID=2023130 RepID=UPI000BC83C80|nr:hypothetical protein [Rhodopirellula sp. MGV]OYP36668.1 hypothetical protein CGZ80_07745 [Rhodopirellula sp. MGV]